MQGMKLPFGLTVCGIDELPEHGRIATHVVSILDPATPVPEAFGSFGEHSKLELRFDDIIEETDGKIAPDRADVDNILAFGRGLGSGAQLLVHCHAGISRSTAALTLILAQALPDQPACEIVQAVHAVREKAWPNLRMIEIGDAMLGRGGTLIDAAADLYRLQVEKRPNLTAFMEKSGRHRELAAASRRSG